MIIDPREIRPLVFCALKYRAFVTVSFLMVSLMGLGASIFWPRMYTSTASIFVEQKNILGPLMEGAAVQTGVQQQARLAGEILFGRKIMTKVLDEQGFLLYDPSPIDIEEEITAVSDRTSVSVSSPNLITIEYSDSYAETAFSTVKVFIEEFIAESAESKLVESNSAYQFIDRQVKEYEGKLRQSEEKLKNFSSENQSVAPGAEGQIRARVSQLQSEISKIEQELREARIRELSLQNQLSGEDRTAEIVAITSSYQTRIATLQEDLDNLRLIYHEEYPDIIRLKEQIESLETQADQEQLATRGENQAVTIVDSTGEVSAVLQQNYYETKISIATLESRISDSRATLDNELQRMRDIPAIELQLKEINREYDVNQAIYTDLLHRREIARVSMNVDREQQGLTLRIHEPPNLPLTPGGPQTYQILAAGLIFGLCMPLGAIGLLQRFDGKVRYAKQISEQLHVPVIATVPQMLTPRAIRRQKTSLIGHAVFIILTTISVVTVSTLWSLGHIVI